MRPCLHRYAIRNITILLAKEKVCRGRPFRASTGFQFSAMTGGRSPEETGLGFQRETPNRRTVKAAPFHQAARQIRTGIWLVGQIRAGELLAQ
jgi:hypothetical protein